MEKDFTISKVGWHTQKERNYEFDTSIVYKAYASLINYLQVNNLTTRTIITSSADVTDDTSIKKSDLTNEGYELVKKGYDKWLDKVVDKKISVDDYKMLNNALKAIRSVK